MNIGNNGSQRLWSTVRRASSVRFPRSLALVFTLSLPAAAQDPRVVVSTTDDVPVTAGVGFPVTDGDLVTVESGEPVVPFFLGGHFQATCGFVPGDIDAFTRLPGSRPGTAESLVFSLLSNEGGFLDGDLITLTRGGGALLLVSELDLASAMGASGASVDVDALSYDDAGRVLFSLNADVTSTTLGTIQDGDVLRLEPGFTGVTLVLSEADVQARFSAATGLADAVLDVQAIEWAGGDLWVAVQSPSRHDGSIIKLNGVPEIVVDETTIGLAGAEVDALGEMRAGDEIPAFAMSLDMALPGDPVHVEAHGQPGAVLMVLMAGNAGFVDFARFPGFGAWYLDRFDPWLRATMAAHAVPFVVLDGAGRYAVDWNFPAGTEFGLGPAGELGWSFQVLDVGTFELSAPFRVQKL